MATQNATVRDLVGRKLGRYEVLAQLASGGMATVYVARAQGVAGFERLVAIKVLHPHLAHDDEFISMFLDEARLAARIRHPNVVPTLDISDSSGDGYFLVMEYIEGDHFGGLLREAAKAGKRLPPGVSLRIVIDALEGLNAAHNLKDGDGHPLTIVHRDISPHNILLGSDGVARITDFGVAKAEVRLSSTRDGQFKGKLSYMAPEQASSGLADQRSDLFSMGIVLWESLTARRLFRADNNGELLNRVLNGVIPKPSEVDPSLHPIDLVMAKALDRDPDRRYQSAAEFIEALEEAGAGLIATGQSGIANPRHVAKSVREWLGAKIDAEHLRIKASIDSLGKSEMTSPGNKLPRPMEASGLTPSEIRPLGSGLAPEDATIGAKPSSLSTGDHAPAEVAPEGRSKTPIYAAVGALAVLLLAGGGAWAAGLFGSSEVDAPVVIETPTAEVAPVVVEEPATPAVVADEAPTDEPIEELIEATEDEDLGEVAGSIDTAASAGSIAARRRRRERERAAAEAAASGGSSAGTATTGSTGSTGTTGTTERHGREDDDMILSNPYRN
jgi:serine/threonine-protein kinase